MVLVAGQTMVVDRGLTLEENLASIRARGLHYVVASRHSESGQWLAQFDSVEGYTQVMHPISPNDAGRRTSKVWVLRRETEAEAGLGFVTRWGFAEEANCCLSS